MITSWSKWVWGRNRFNEWYRQRPSRSLAPSRLKLNQMVPSASFTHLQQKFHQNWIWDSMRVKLGSRGYWQLRCCSVPHMILKVAKEETRSYHLTIDSSLVRCCDTKFAILYDKADKNISYLKTGWIEHFDWNSSDKCVVFPPCV